jgi:hypothetical protein
MSAESLETILARIEERQKAFSDRYDRDQAHASEQRKIIVERHDTLELRLEPIFKVYERGQGVWWMVGMFFAALAGLVSLLWSIGEKIIGKLWP